MNLAIMKMVMMMLAIATMIIQLSFHTIRMSLHIHFS